MIRKILNSLHEVLRASQSAKFFLPLIIFSLSLGSCKKDSDIGLDLVPGNDLINLKVTDTTTLVTSTVIEDSLRTDEPGAAVMGSINDVMFGRTTAGLFTQVRIPNNQLNISFGNVNDLVLDSIVFSLSFKPEYYGDTLQSQTFSVYQMTEGIEKSKNYYSNRPKQFYSSRIGSASFSPRPNTKVVLNGDTFAPHIRIPLDLNFGQQILNQSGTTNLNGNNNFLNFLKGLYVQPDSNGISPGQGVLSTFGLLDTMSRLTLYYRNVVTPDTSHFSFIIGSDAANYCYFKHDYSNAPIAGSIGQSGSHQEVYVQGLSGLKTRIDMPNLDGWKNKMPIAINKAELVVKVDPAYATTGFPANTRLYLTYADSTGKEYTIADVADLSTFGGDLNTTTNEYHMNLTRFFQSVVSGEKDFHGLFIKDLTPVASARRAVLGGDASPLYKMYMRVTYTTIN